MLSVSLARKNLLPALLPQALDAQKRIWGSSNMEDGDRLRGSCECWGVWLIELEARLAEPCHINIKSTQETEHLLEM